MIERKTIFSPDRVYRYTLWREWSDDLFVNRAKNGFVQFIGLNPSTADETVDDATIRCCKGFSKRWGYSTMCMTNLFAYRATLPANMKSAPNPVGEDNIHHLLKVSSEAGIVVACWGKDGKFQNQGLAVYDTLSRVGVKFHCLSKNNDSSPHHPLYLPSDSRPVEYQFP